MNDDFNNNIMFKIIIPNTWLKLTKKKNFKIVQEHKKFKIIPIMYFMWQVIWCYYELNVVLLNILNNWCAKILYTNITKELYDKYATISKSDFLIIIIILIQIYIFFTILKRAMSRHYPFCMLPIILLYIRQSVTPSLHFHVSLHILVYYHNIYFNV